MQWTIHGERPIYESPWVNLALVDVELPDGQRFDHHVVRLDRPAVGMVVIDDHDRCLLLWRHRFISDTWGWEIPAGGVDADEASDVAARRECLEETGWEANEAVHQVTYQPSNGLSDQRFEIFTSRGAVHRGEPTDPFESERIEWVPRATVLELMAEGQIGDGLSLTGLLYSLTVGSLAP